MLVSGIELGYWFLQWKKLLKALEILELFVVETPFIEISEIVELLGLKLAGCLVEICN